MNINELKKKLIHFKNIKKNEVDKIPLGIWIKYLSDEGLYRSGGVLICNGFPNYFMLKNPNNNKTWSVNLKINNIFISDKLDLNNLYKKKEKQENENSKKKSSINNKDNNKENYIDKEIEREKEILYQLYKKGLLEIIDED